MKNSVSLAKGLSIINSAINGALNSDDILTELAKYGYTAEVIRN